MKKCKTMLSMVVCLMLLVSMMATITAGAEPEAEFLTFEYLTNEFEDASSTTGWTFPVDPGSNNKATYTAGIGVDGTGAVKLTGMEKNDRFQSPSSRWRKGGKYLVKVWMKGTENANIQLCMNAGDWMRWIGSHSNNGQPWIYRYLNKNVDVTTEWQEYTFDIEILDFMTDNTATATAIDKLEVIAPIFFCSNNDVASGFELCVDKFSITEQIAPENIKNNYFESGIGDGSEVAPYEITTVSDILKITELIHNNEYLRTSHFKLMNDLDFTGVTNFKGISGGLIDANGNLQYYFSDTRRSFKGTFDGQGHVIKNLFIPEKPEASGGFFRVIEGATIKNLGFENADISGYRSVGILTGVDAGGSTIENCFARNSKTLSSHRWSSGYIGALVGEMNAIDCPTSTYNNCYTTNVSVSIRISDTEGEYGTSSSIGGIVGATMGNTITNVVLNNCYTDMGKLASNESDANTGLTKNNCYVSVTAGSLNAADLNGTGSAFIEGKPSYNNGLPVLSWEKDRVAAAPDNDLFASKKGDGTKDNPYQLTTAADFTKMAELMKISSYCKAHYKMMNDIDLSSLTTFDGLASWSNADLYFQGTFDGNGHVISGMKMNCRNVNETENRPRGLFQGMKNATITNLGFENCNVIGFNSGVLAGYDEGSTVTNCFVRNCTVSAPNGNVSYSGAFIGGALYNSTNANADTVFENCYSVNNTVPSDSGGFKGSCTWSTVTNTVLKNCYTTSAKFSSSGGDEAKLADSANLSVTNSYKAVTTETITAAQLGTAFIDNDTEYNNGLPVLAWEADRLPEVEEPATYTVSVTVGANGSVTKDGAAVPASFEVEENETVTLTLVPDAKYVAKAKVNGADYTVTNNQVTLTVAENTTIAVTFERIPDVTPGFAGNDTSYTWFKTEGGVPTIFTYHKLAEFNTGETDLEYGVKLWNNANPENKVTLAARVSETETAKAVPGAQFAIKVYGDAIKADQNYTIVPYIGDVNGTEVTPDHE